MKKLSTTTIPLSEELRDELIDLKYKFKCATYTELIGVMIDNLKTNVKKKRGKKK